MVELVNSWGSEDLLKEIGALSHGGKTKKSTKEFIDMLIRLGHMSVFEHVGTTFYVKTSIIVQRQWMRHRHMSFLERSLRYTEPAKELAVPLTRFGSVEAAAEAYMQFTKAIQSYNTLLSNGTPKEVARAVLPLGLETEFYVTANLRSWLHFLDLRLAPEAQEEIRQEAERVLEYLKQLFPHTIESWERYKEGGR